MRLGANKPEVLSLDVTDFYLVYQHPDWDKAVLCDLSNVSFRLAASDGDPCAFPILHPACDASCGRFLGEVAISVSGLPYGNGNYIATWSASAEQWIYEDANVRVVCWITLTSGYFAPRYGWVYVFDKASSAGTTVPPTGMWMPDPLDCENISVDFNYSSQHAIVSVPPP